MAKKAVARKSTAPLKPKSKAKAGGREPDVRRKSLELLEKRLRKVDGDLTEIEEGLLEAGLSKSTVVDQDIEARKKTLAMDVSDGVGGGGGKSFYRNFVLRCEACKKQFENEIKIQPISRIIYCPTCGKDHAIGIHPSTRIHHIVFPKSLKLLKHD